MQDRSREERCLKCSGVLFRKNRLPNGAWAMDPDHRLQLQSTGDLLFYECPECGAKNAVTKTSGSPQTGTQLQITHIASERPD